MSSALDFVNSRANRGGVPCQTCRHYKEVAAALNEILDLAIEQGKAAWSWQALRDHIAGRFDYHLQTDAMLKHIKKCEGARYDRIQQLRSSGIS